MNERKRMASEANVRFAALHVLKEEDSVAALEACRIIWWLCCPSSSCSDARGDDHGRTERALRVVQMDGCLAQLVRALHDDGLKVMAARTMLHINSAISGKKRPVRGPSRDARLPQWFEMQVLVRQPNCIGGRTMHHRVFLKARLKGNRADVVPVAEAYTVGDLKAKIVAQPQQASDGMSTDSSLNGWRLFLTSKDGTTDSSNAQEMEDDRCLAHYALTNDSVVTFAKPSVE